MATNQDVFQHVRMDHDTLDRDDRADAEPEDVMRLGLVQEVLEVIAQPNAGGGLLIEAIFPPGRPCQRASARSQ
jgi:hypothetical protein